MKPTITAVLAPKAFTEALIYDCQTNNLHEGLKGTWHCHHVTLAFNKPWNRDKGQRRIELTHIGFLPGRVIAFKVNGADDSLNKTPHITAFVADGASAKESNLITEWKRLKNVPKVFYGTITTL